MRLLFGIILGAFLTIGGAYMYDTATAPSLASTAQTLEGKPMVNWDVVSARWKGWSSGVQNTFNRLSARVNT